MFSELLNRQYKARLSFSSLLYYYYHNDCFGSALISRRMQHIKVLSLTLSRNKVEGLFSVLVSLKPK
jgi:uncharacterized UPF0160 family protein